MSFGSAVWEQLDGESMSTQPAYDELPSRNDPALLTEIAGWNWGAFLGSWAWAFAHRQPVLGVACLLGFAFWGLVGIICAIYLGVSGSELAWRQRRFESVDHFRRVQRAWALWGLPIVGLTAVIQLMAWLYVY